MKTLKTPMSPVKQRVKKVNSMVHKPNGIASVQPIKPAKPAFVKKPK